MHIRHLIHSEDDLKIRFGQRFLKRWQALLRVYKSKYRRMDGVNVMKVASVALAFLGAAESGDAAVGMRFDELMHNGSMEIEGEQFVVCEDDDCRGLLMWDAACLMLEETDLSGKSQWAYDEADSHETYAYVDEVLCVEYSVPGDVGMVGNGSVTSTQGAVSVAGVSSGLALSKSVKDGVFLEVIMSYLDNNVKKPADVRRQIRLMVVDMIFTQGIVLPDAVRDEIMHYDDVGDVCVEELRSFLSNVTHITLVDNRGTYIGNQNKYI